MGKHVSTSTVHLLARRINTVFTGRIDPRIRALVISQVHAITWEPIGTAHQQTEDHLC